MSISIISPSKTIFIQHRQHWKIQTHPICMWAERKRFEGWQCPNRFMFPHYFEETFIIPLQQIFLSLSLSPLYSLLIVSMIENSPGNWKRKKNYFMALKFRKRERERDIFSFLEWKNVEIILIRGQCFLSKPRLWGFRLWVFSFSPSSSLCE